MEAYDDCGSCVAANTNSTVNTVMGLVLEDFRQYLEFCASATFIATTLTHYAHGTARTEVFFIEPSEVFDGECHANLYPVINHHYGDNIIVDWIIRSATREQQLQFQGLDRGPVIGSVVALVLLLGAVFWLRQRKRNKATAPTSEPFDESYGKAQLHSDDIPKPVYPTPELHPDSIHEMEGSHPEFREAEKPANEAPARELPTNETAGPRAGHDEDEGHQQTATR
jgi:hypothetical protein